MIYYLINGLQSQIDSVAWVENYGGLTRTITRRIKNREGTFEDESYPVSAYVTDQECWDNSLYKLLTPDESKRSVLFWQVTSPVGIDVNPLIAKGMGQSYVQTANLLVWLNLKRMGLEDEPEKTGMLMQELMSKLHKVKISVADPVKVKGKAFHTGILPHTQDIFAAWTWGARGELFFGDYDFFGLEYEFRWNGMRDCAPAFVPPQAQEC